MTTTPLRRMSAAERREQLLGLAAEVDAEWAASTRTRITAGLLDHTTEATNR
jgi:hypothetical protein